jgi:hypothetical protein
MGAQNTVVGHLLTQDGAAWTFSIWRWEDDIVFTVTSALYGNCVGFDFAWTPTMNTVNRAGAVVMRHYRAINRNTLDQVAQWIQDLGWTLISNQ